VTHHRRLTLSAVLLATSALSACSGSTAPENNTPVARLVEIKVERGARVELTGAARVNHSPENAGRPISSRAITLPKIEPQVRALLDAAGSQTLIEVIVGVEPRGPIPSLPALDPKESRISPKNVKQLAERRRVLIAERRDRLATQEPFVQRIISEGGLVFDRHTLCNCFAAKVPAALVTSLASEPNIRHIDPWVTNDPPPRNDSVADGRRIIGSDPYFDVIVSTESFSNYIGLLDTGVRASHSLYKSPDRISSLNECTHGGDNCEDIGDPLFNPLDTYWNHGTSTGAIISGNQNLGDASRGISYLNIDSWKIYPGSSGLDVNATIKAFNASILSGDGILVAEMQPNLSPTSSLAVVANDAFDSGSAVIAANGNFGPGPGTVDCPANAQRAIGVGAFDIDRLTQEGYQSRGPTVDNRIKPDLQMPTNSITASNSSDTALHSFGGTSGATPYASGAAASLRNWYIAQNLCPASDDCPPGLIYAGLLMFGSKFGPQEWDNTVGTGSTHLGAIDPACSHWLVGSAVVESNGMTIDIPFTADSAFDVDFRTALWWPDAMDGSTLIHSEVDLIVLDPSGAEAASSASVNSVFENTIVPGPMASGQWTIRIAGTRIGNPQTVYYTAYSGGGQACP